MKSLFENILLEEMARSHALAVVAALMSQGSLRWIEQKANLPALEAKCCCGLWRIEGDFHVVLLVRVLRQEQWMTAQTCLDVVVLICERDLLHACWRT